MKNLAMIFAGIAILGAAHWASGQGPKPLTVRQATLTKAGDDFAQANRFKVEIDGMNAKSIDAVEGLISESDVTAPPTIPGGSQHPGNPLHNRITLSRPFDGDPTFYAWKQANSNGKTDRRSISVIFLNDAGQESMRISLSNCWPNKWTGPALNARSSGHCSEAIELSWETLQFKKS